METAEKLTNLQLELLKIFSVKLSEQQLLEIKEVLANYFASKATEEMDKLWEANGWTEETMKQWRNEHLRVSEK